MKNRQADEQTTLVAPLLRGIATEIVERTLEISRLEARLAHARRRRSSRETDALTAQLAVHRREVRQASDELKRMGWSRDATQALRFVNQNASWQLEGTGFYKALV